MSKQVVITGIGVVCCLGDSKEKITKRMIQGESGLKQLNIMDTTDFIFPIGGEVEGEFSAEESREYLLAEMALKEAIGDADLIYADVKQAGLIYGTCNGGIRAIENCGTISEITEEQAEAYKFNSVSDKLSQKHKLGGVNLTINTACSASGNAIGHAYELIKNSDAKIMVAGGADAMSKAVYAGFSSLQSLNSQVCSPYDKNSGLNLGEGAGILILEEKENALARGAHIYSEITGYGSSNDAYHPTAPDKEGGGIATSIQMALEESLISSKEVKYINTHGTGTNANDGAELRGMKKVFGDELSNILISSSKGYFGHNLGAAAVLELATTLLMMEKGYLPSNINLNNVRDDCTGYNLIRGENYTFSKYPEYILINNSAFGGYNSSIVCKRFDSEYENGKVFLKSKVYITDDVFINKNHIVTFDDNEEFEGNERFSLKNFRPELYQRRMNLLTQMGVAAAANIHFEDTVSYEVGMCMGVKYGSMESAEKYLSSIWNKGFDKASSIYFPDVVLNSTGGKIHTAFSIKGYGNSITTGGNELTAAISNMYYYVSSNKINSVLVGSGEEASPFENILDKKEKVSYFEMLKLSKNKISEDDIEIISSQQNFGLSEDKLEALLSEDDKGLEIINVSSDDYRREKINKWLLEKYGIEAKIVSESYLQYFKNQNTSECLVIDSTKNGNNIVLKLRK